MELTRKCNKCGETKPYSQMVKTGEGSGYKDNIKPLCKVCKNIEGKAYKAKMKQKNPDIMKPMVSKNTTGKGRLESCGLTGYSGPRERGPNEALPPRTSKLVGVFKPPVWQIRAGSDLSSIRSVGMPT